MEQGRSNPLSHTQTAKQGSGKEAGARAQVPSACREEQGPSPATAGNEETVFLLATDGGKQNINACF